MHLSPANRLCGTLCVLLACASMLCSKAIAQRVEGVLYSQTLVSPNKKFVAELVEGKQPTHSFDRLMITDSETKKSSYVELFTPLYAWAWTDDSKTIATVEHIAGGSESVLLHYEDGQWHRHEVELPDNLAENSHYGVVYQQLDDGKVTVTYKVEYDPGDGSKRKYLLYKLAVDAATGKVIQVLLALKISSGKYLRLPLFKHSEIKKCNDLI